MAMELSDELRSKIERVRQKLLVKFKEKKRLVSQLGMVRRCPIQMRSEVSQKIFRHLTLRTYAKDQIIMDSSTLSFNLYVISSGEVGCYLEDRTLMRRLKSGESFGELAVTFSRAGKTSYHAFETTQIFVLLKADVPSIMRETERQHQIRLTSKAFKPCVLFSEADLGLLSYIYYHAKRMDFVKSQRVFVAGQPVDGFYLILEGEFTLCLDSTLERKEEEKTIHGVMHSSQYVDGDQEQISNEKANNESLKAIHPRKKILSKVRHLSQGGFFGEDELLKKEASRRLQCLCESAGGTLMLFTPTVFASLLMVNNHVRDVLMKKSASSLQFQQQKIHQIHHAIDDYQQLLLGDNYKRIHKKVEEEGKQNGKKRPRSSPPRSRLPAKPTQADKTEIALSVAATPFRDLVKLNQSAKQFNQFTFDLQTEKFGASESSKLSSSSNINCSTTAAAAQVRRAMPHQQPSVSTINNYRRLEFIKNPSTEEAEEEFNRLRSTSKSKQQADTSLFEMILKNNQQQYGGHFFKLQQRILSASKGTNSQQQQSQTSIQHNSPSSPLSVRGTVLITKVASLFEETRVDQLRDECSSPISMQSQITAMEFKRYGNTKEISHSQAVASPYNRLDLSKHSRTIGQQFTQKEDDWHFSSSSNFAAAVGETGLQEVTEEINLNEMSSTLLHDQHTKLSSEDTISETNLRGEIQPKYKENHQTSLHHQSSTRLKQEKQSLLDLTKGRLSLSQTRKISEDSTGRRQLQQQQKYVNEETKRACDQQVKRIYDLAERCSSSSSRNKKQATDNMIKLLVQNDAVILQNQAKSPKAQTNSLFGLLYNPLNKPAAEASRPATISSLSMLKQPSFTSSEVSATAAIFKHFRKTSTALFEATSSLKSINGTYNLQKVALNSPSDSVSLQKEFVFSQPPSLKLASNNHSKHRLVTTSNTLTNTSLNKQLSQKQLKTYNFPSTSSQLSTQFRKSINSPPAGLKQLFFTSSQSSKYSNISQPSIDSMRSHISSNMQSPRAYIDSQPLRDEIVENHFENQQSQHAAESRNNNEDLGYNFVKTKKAHSKQRLH